MTATGQHLSDDDAASVLTLIKDADSVELKLTVPESRSPHDRGGARDGSARCADPPGVLLRHAGSALNERGVVVRARRVQGGATTPSSSCGRSCPRELPGGVRKSPGFGVEVDAMPGGYVCSGSLKGDAGAPTCGRRSGQAAGAQAVHQGAARVLRRARSGGVELDDLSVLGPIFVLKLKFAPWRSRAGSSSRCGSIRTARASSSSPPSAPRPRRSRSPPRRGLPERARHGPRASRRRRPARRSSSSPSD